MKKLFALLTIPPHLQRRFFFSALTLYAAILILGSLPGARAEVAHLASGVVLHTATYSAMTVLLFIGVRGGVALRACKAFLLVTAMGAGDEWVQHFLSYRSGTLTDWAIDMLAAALTAVVLCVVCRAPQPVPAASR